MFALRLKDHDIRVSHNAVTHNDNLTVCSKKSSLILFINHTYTTIKMSDLLSTSTKVDSHLDDLFKNSVMCILLQLKKKVTYPYFLSVRLVRVKLQSSLSLPSRSLPTLQRRTKTKEKRKQTKLFWVL